MQSFPNRKKKILFISQSFYPAVGGVSTFLVSLIHNLLEFGYEISVLHFKVSTKAEVDAFRRLHPGVVQYEIDRREFSKSTLKGYSSFKEVLYQDLHGLSKLKIRSVDEIKGFADYMKVSGAFLKEAERIVETNNIDIVNIQDYQMFGCLRLKNIKAKKILSLHAPIISSHSPATKSWLRDVGNLADNVILSTPEYKRAAVRDGIIAEDKIVVIPPFVDPVFQQSLFDIQNQPQFDTLINKKNVNFTCIQRFDSKSGQAQLIRAFALIVEKYPNVRLILVGGPSFTDSISNVRHSYFSEAKSLVEKLGIQNKIIFLGNVDYALLPQIYQQSDVICMLSKMECFGLAVTEAMYYSLSVLVTAVGGLNYQIKQGKNGLKVQVDNIEDTATAMAQLARSTNERRAMGIRGRKQYEREFSHSVLAKKYHDIYKNI